MSQVPIELPPLKWEWGRGEIAQLIQTFYQILKIKTLIWEIYELLYVSDGNYIAEVAYKLTAFIFAFSFLLSTILDARELHRNCIGQGGEQNILLHKPEKCVER